ncbi:MAG TPA: MFS transporter [Nitrospirota bacterium]|nr:MFS transporter [Nitrospirota bacterium]
MGISAMTNDATLKRSTLLIATLSAFLTPFTVSSVNIALPAIGREFHMSAVLMSWVPTAYLLSAAVFLVPFGRLADIHGRKRVFSWGIGIFTASSLLLAVSPSAPALIAFRVLQGFGSAMIFGTGMAILTSVFPAAERGRVLGMNVAAVYLGLSLGPTFGGFLTHQFGWRSIFLMNVPLGLLVIFFLATKLKAEWAEARGERFDLAGSLLYSASLVSLMYGLSLLPRRMGIVLTAAGVAGAVMFVLWERSAESPLLDMDLFFHNATFAFSNLAALINYSATNAVGFLMSLYLQYLKGFTPQGAGMVLVSQPLVMAVFSPLAGRLSDRIEPRVVASIGMAITASGLFLLTFVDESSSVGFDLFGLVLLGFGFALFSSPNTNAVMSSIEKKFYGVGSATLGTMRLTGQMLSMGITMVIFALSIGSARITPEYYPLFLKSMKTGFVIFSTLCFAGIFASLARGKVR